jgi:hypothetical protein
MGPHAPRILLPVRLLPVILAFVAGSAPWLQAQPAPPQTLGNPNDGNYIEYTYSGVRVTASPRPTELQGVATETPVRASGVLRVSMPGRTVTQVSLTAKAVIGMTTLQQVSWPPKGDEGWVGDGQPRRVAELPFDLEVPIKAGQSGWVSFGACMTGGTSDCTSVMISFSAPAGIKAAPARAAGVPAVPAGPGPPAAARGKPPCDEPLHFYPGVDLGRFYTGQPSLNYTREQFGAQLVDALRRYEKDGHEIVDGTQPHDVANIAMTYTSDSAVDLGKRLAPSLQAAARARARERQATNPSYRVSPGELFELSLRVSQGNVRDALLTCHAALYRDHVKQQAAAVNKPFVEREGVLAKMRNEAGYSTAPFAYTTPAGSPRTVSPRSVGGDEQGVWYHYFGLAALEYTDRYGTASYLGAFTAIPLIGDTSKTDALARVASKGFPVTRLGEVLGDFAIALEEGIRSQAGKPPDVDKHCVNYAALLAGARLKRLVDEITHRPSGDPDAYSPRTRFDTTAQRLVAPNGGIVYRSPVSLRIEGTAGEVFSFDQSSKRFGGNTPAVVAYPFDEEGGTIGLVAFPLFEVRAVRLVATGSGPVQLALYDAASRRSAAYEFTVRKGAAVAVDLHATSATLDGRALVPVSGGSASGRPASPSGDPRGSTAPSKRVLDDVLPGSARTWTDRYDPRQMNPTFSIDEVRSPFDGSTALRTRAHGATMDTCETKFARHVYDTGPQVTDGSQLEAYLGFSSNGTRFNLPSVAIALLDASGQPVGSRVYFGKGTIGAFNRQQLGKTGHQELPSAEGLQRFDLEREFGRGLRFEAVAVSLMNYACEGDNAVVFDHLVLTTLGGS